MNIYEVTEAVKARFEEESVIKGNPLFGTKIEIDPYKKLENSIPFIMIEGINSMVKTNPEGYATEFVHTLELTLVVNAAREKRESYKTKASELASCIIGEVCKINDYRLKIFPVKVEYGEIMVGSMKCSAAKITIELKTLFFEE